MASTFLLIIGHREGLSWIIHNERMAFPNKPSPSARNLTPGDQLLLYTSRGCFNNPPRGVSRVIGTATVTGTLAALPTPVEVGGRLHSYGCKIHLDALARLGDGVALRPLVDRLDAFSKNPEAWRAWLRRTLLPLSAHDSQFLAARLAPLTQPPQKVRAPYLQWLPPEPGSASDISLTEELLG